MPLNLTPWGHQLHELLWDVVLVAEDLFGAAGSATVVGFLALGGRQLWNCSVSRFLSGAVRFPNFLEIVSLLCLLVRTSLVLLQTHWMF